MPLPLPRKAQTWKESVLRSNTPCLESRPVLRALLLRLCVGLRVPIGAWTGSMCFAFRKDPTGDLSVCSVPVFCMELKLPPRLLLWLVMIDVSEERLGGVLDVVPIITLSVLLSSTRKWPWTLEKRLLVVVPFGNSPMIPGSGIVSWKCGEHKLCHGKLGFGKNGLPCWPAGVPSSGRMGLFGYDGALSGCISTLHIGSGST